MKSFFCVGDPFGFALFFSAGKWINVVGLRRVFWGFSSKKQIDKDEY
jgi:hypothetical protein